MSARGIDLIATASGESWTMPAAASTARRIHGFRAAASAHGGRGTD